MKSGPRAGGDYIMNRKKTYTATPSDIKRDWYVIDAEGMTLGRLATEIARRLRGKHKPEFTPHMDTGDYIVVINTKLISVTGNKANDKMYYRHSGYPGGLRSMNFKQLNQKHPTRPLEFAVKGMLPKGPLGRQMLRKLKLYAGTEHPHEAQQPKQLAV